MKFEFDARSTRDDGKVSGRLILVVEAETMEKAEEIIRDSLPGFDWARWESTFGAVPV